MGQVRAREVVQRARQQRCRKPFHLLDSKSTTYYQGRLMGEVAGEVEVEGVSVSVGVGAEVEGGAGLIGDRQCPDDEVAEDDCQDGAGAAPAARR
jgi:hypothetical protein